MAPAGSDTVKRTEGLLWKNSSSCVVETSVGYHKIRNRGRSYEDVLADVKT